MDRISELITLFLVGLGQKLSRLSDAETRMISLFLASLVLAAAAANALHVIAGR
jgi:hypothetical protein